MWDFSQLWLSSEVAKGGRGIDCSVLIAHGFLTDAVRDETALAVGEDEVILRPCHTSSCSSADIWAGLKAVVPPALWKAIFDEPPGPNMVIGLNTAGDHATTNIRVMAHIQNVLPEGVIAFDTFCKSHGTALCISPCVKHCNLVSLAFCLSKQFRTEQVLVDLWAGVRTSLENIWYLSAKQRGRNGGHVKTTWLTHPPCWNLPATGTTFVHHLRKFRLSAQ